MLLHYIICLFMPINFLFSSGSAFVNQCNECVGGTTKRASDFGADQCGECKSDPNYVEIWDCYGTCNGTAIIDACGECVGKWMKHFYNLCANPGTQQS